jgi:hypothetical protein
VSFTRDSKGVHATVEPPAAEPPQPAEAATAAAGKACCSSSGASSSGSSSSGEPSPQSDTPAATAAAGGGAPAAGGGLPYSSFRDDQGSCVVCFEDYVPGELLKELPCGERPRESGGVGGWGEGTDRGLPPGEGLGKTHRKRGQGRRDGAVSKGRNGISVTSSLSSSRRCVPNGAPGTLSNCALCKHADTHTHTHTQARPCLLPQPVHMHHTLILQPPPAHLTCALAPTAANITCTWLTLSLRHTPLNQPPPPPPALQATGTMPLASTPGSSATPAAHCARRWCGARCPRMPCPCGMSCCAWGWCPQTSCWLAATAAEAGAELRSRQRGALVAMAVGEAATEWGVGLGAPGASLGCDGRVMTHREAVGTPGWG